MSFIQGSNSTKEVTEITTNGSTTLLNETKEEFVKINIDYGADPNCKSLDFYINDKLRVSTLVSDDYKEFSFKVSESLKVDVKKSTEFEVSDTVYSNKSFDVSSEDTIVRSAFVDSEGKKMYTVGDTNNTIFQYTLSTTYDISTASYDSKNKSVVNETSNPQYVSVNNDGTKMFVYGYSEASIFQYTLSTAYDVSTANYDSKSFSPATQDSATTAFKFKPDGTKLYVLGGTNNAIYQYTLSTAWDISTASYDGKSKNVGETALYGLDISSDGTKLIVSSDGANTLIEFTLSTAWDISTAVEVESFNTSAQTTSPKSVTLDSTGRIAYVFSGTEIVYQYILFGEDNAYVQVEY